MSKTNLVDLKTPIKVTLWPYSAFITSISWRRGNPLFKTDDAILVWLELEKPVCGTSGFGISLPVKDYEQGEFINAIIGEGLTQLQSIKAKYREEMEKQKQEEERKKELDTIVQNIINRLSGD